MTPGSQIRGLVEINSAENAIRIRVKMDHTSHGGSLVTMKILPVQCNRVIGHGKDEKERISMAKWRKVTEKVRANNCPRGDDYAKRLVWARRKR
jgi:hypothetical protein